MSGTLRERVYFSIWLAVVIVALVTPSITSVVALIAAVVVLLATGLHLLVVHGPGFLLRDRFPALLLVAFGLLAIAFVLTARSPRDLSFLFNYTGLLIAAPMLFLARRRAGMEWTRGFVILSALGTIILFLHAVVDVAVLGELRAQGIMIGGANRIGQIALLLGMIGLGGLMVFDRTWHRIGLVAVTALTPVTIVLAGSRGVALASILGLGIAMVFAIAARPTFRRVGAIGVLLVFGLAAVVGGIGIAGSTSDRLLNVATDIQRVIETGNARDNNIQVRLDLYRSAIDSFGSSPLVGVGWQKSLEDASRITAADESLNPYFRAHQFTHMHSDALGLAASAGLMGLAAWVLMIVAPWFGLGPKDALYRFRLYMLTAMMCVFHFYALTDASMIFDVSLYIYVILSALIAGTFKIPPGEPESGKAG